MALDRPDVMEEILAEHLEELGFLWELRQASLFSADAWPIDLAAIESRAAAHLNGLLVGGGRSADLAHAALEGDEPADAIAGGLVLLSLGARELREALVMRLPELPPPSQDGVRIALRYGPLHGIESTLRTVAKEGAPLPRAIALDALGFHRVMTSVRADSLFTDPDPMVRRIALTAAGRSPIGLDAGVLEAALAEEDPAIRSVALVSAARIGLPELPRICRQAAKTDSVPEAVAFLGVAGGPEDLSFLDRCLGTPELAEAALEALGSGGLPAGVPLLLRAMRNPVLLRPAGAAFTRITGVDVASEERPKPPEDATEDELDEFDDTYPPDPEKAEAFWADHGSDFAPPGPWQCGLDVAKEPFGAVFGKLSLAARRDVFLRERARDPRAAPALEIEALQAG